MKKYAKVINEETKECEVGLGTDTLFYEAIAMAEEEVEQAFDGRWYLMGFAPPPLKKTYIEKRVAEYPKIEDQLDMIYWDKVNQTNLWQEKITEIKNKYPKE